MNNSIEPSDPGSTVFKTAPTNELAAVTLRKVTWRLIPFLFVLYVIAWLDRVNVGFAGLQMNTDLGFSSTVFGFGSGIFFLGYCLFEIPSNIILERVGARLWISRIMVTWGLISAGMMFVRTPATFYLLRFLLGVAEAGFFPGVIYYLSLWYPTAHRARAIAAFMTAVPVTGLIGGPLSGALLELDGLHGLAGWQWLFLLEGLPAVILGTSVLFYLKDRPETTHWLTPAERDWLVETLAAERKACLPRPNIRVALTDKTIWNLGIIFLLVAAGFYGYSFWAPLIIKSLTGLSNFKVGLVLGAISAVTIVGMLLNSYHSDRTGERAIHIAVPAVRDGGRPCRMRPAAPARLSHYRSRTRSAGALRELWPVLVDADSVPYRAGGGRRDSFRDDDCKCRQLRRTDADRDIQDTHRHSHWCVPLVRWTSGGRGASCTQNTRRSNANRRTIRLRRAAACGGQSCALGSQPRGSRFGC